MNKDFIPYEQALEMKELGFNESCLMYYDYSCTLVESGVYECKAPLYQQAFRWFRDKQNIDNCISYSRIEDNSWYYQYYKSGLVGGFKTYEEAEIACLEKLIEIVKQKQNEK
jgi:hypothetical protein